MSEFQDPVTAHQNVGVPITGGDWAQETIAAEDADGMTFQDCVFDHVRFEDVSLREVSFIQCSFEECVFDDCDLGDAQMIACKGAGLQVVGGKLDGLIMADCKFDEVDIGQTAERFTLAESKVGRLAFNGPGAAQQNVTMSGSEFDTVLAENSTWRGGSLVETDLMTWADENARFEQCSLIRVGADGLDFSTVEFVKCNLYQSSFVGARLRRADGTIFAECDLTEADCSEGEFPGCLFGKTKAPAAKFDAAVLNSAMFPKAVLTKASFAGAMAVGSVWTEADLTGANLERLTATKSVFRNACLDDANVVDASFVEADLHGIDAPLDGANTLASRRTVDWRAEREAQARGE